jgi:hypothetical protein
VPFLPDTLQVTVSDFQGPWDPAFIEPTDIALPKGMLAKNVSYLPGKVAQRYGYSQVFIDSLATGGYSSFVNWLFQYLAQPRNFMIGFARGVGVRIADLQNVSGTIGTLIPDTISAGCYAVPSGLRAIIAQYDANGQGTTGGSIFGYPAAAFGFPASVDPLFTGPVRTTMTVTESGTGACTAGIHRFGFIMTTRNGYTTKWGPIDSNNIYAPASFTSAGGKIINLAVPVPSGGWPNDINTIQVLMSTAANPAQYYIVPDAIAGVAGFTINIQINISDGDLAATGGDASPYQFLACIDASGAVPFKPNALVNYSSRMGYLTVDNSGLPVLYFSNPNNYQSLTKDQHGIYLPGNLQIAAAQPIQAVCYIFGPHWTFSVSDNGDVPATWASAQKVDGSIGTLSPWGVYVNASQGFAWVADEGGLFLFQGGAYPFRPISYYQTPDWQRINWNAAIAVKVIDDKNDKVVRVFAPLDGATQPTHILSWDYTLGTNPEQAHYSLDNIQGYQMGAPAIIENPMTRVLETWIAPGSASQPVIRKNNGKESQPNRDWNSAINGVYQTALFPGAQGQSGTLNMFHAVRTRALGSGNLSVVPKSLDGTLSAGPFNITLGATPGKLYTNRFYLMNEACSLLVSMNQIDGYWELSSLEMAYTEGCPQR